MRKSVLFALTGLLALGAALSCSKDNTVDQNIKSKIVGTWKLYSIDAENVPTNDKIITDFTSDGIHKYTNFSGEIWNINERSAYSLKGKSLLIEPLVETEEESLTVMANVFSVDKYKLDLRDVSYSNGRKCNQMDFQRVNNDYSSMILGMWEGTQVIGDHPHGDAEHCWEYKSDGTYVYYSKNEFDEWVPDPDNDGNVFFVKGDFVVSSWSYKGESFQECWDIINCNAYEMEWTGLRRASDGTESITTFRMKRVLTPEEISAKILGKWKMISTNDEDILTDSRTVLTFKPGGTLMQTSFSDGKWEYQKAGEYSLNDKDVSFLSTHNTIVAINDKEMIFSPVKSASRTIYNSQNWARVNDDFSEAILGTWEGVAMTGSTTYGDIDHRWEYLSNGSYIYYSKDAAGEWVPDKDDTENTYAVDGNYLCSRWKVKGVAYREWWDIDTCDESTMIWSALRKNSYGEREYTVFVLVRVED